MASISGNNKIVLKAGFTQGAAEHEEGPLTAAATPGMNVQMSVTPEEMGRHSWTPGNTDYVGTGTGTTAVRGSVKVLKEDVLGQGGTITTEYSAGDNAFVHIAKAGDVLQVLVASGQNVSKGDGLSAASTGKWAVDASNPVVEALEGSGGALGADAHLRVRVL